MGNVVRSEVTSQRRWSQVHLTCVFFLGASEFGSSKHTDHRGGGDRRQTPGVCNDGG